MTANTEFDTILERRVLVTRPRADALALAERLRAMRIDGLIEPMMTIAPRGPETLDLADAQAVLITSANGAHALAERTDSRDIPMFAVGDASARTLRDHGFTRVESADGDVGDLAALVSRRLDAAAGPLVHIAGTTVAGDLAGMLGVNGFDYRRVVLYVAEPVAALSKRGRAALALGNAPGGVSGVLLFSPRTARIFDAIMTEAGLVDQAATLQAFCLSCNVAAATGLAWRQVLVAEQPTQESLLDTVAACYD